MIHHCNHRFSSDRAGAPIFTTARYAILVLAACVVSACAGNEHSQAVRAEKMAQGERLQHIIYSYRVCLHAKKNNETLPPNCAI